MSRAGAVSLIRPTHGHCPRRQKLVGRESATVFEVLAATFDSNELFRCERKCVGLCRNGLGARNEIGTRCLGQMRPKFDDAVWCLRDHGVRIAHFLMVSIEQSLQRVARQQNLEVRRLGAGLVQQTRTDAATLRCSRAIGHRHFHIGVG